ncbi:efflux RND transporter permease subunit [Oryzobacter terrae]|uniref:efflux RND transporter permease subunit n=1 Tax=Oryzobacter terrae TaxID=1620385 RepID=UPI00366CD0F2
MVGRIVGAGVGSRVLVAAVALVALVFSGLQLRSTSLEPVPEFAPVTVEVQSEALGLSAQEVEDLVTVPLESNLLSGVAWVNRMQSSSLPGLSSIVMTFEDGTDPVRARQVVQERLTQGALLTNASKAPVMLQPTSAANRVMMIGLSSRDRSLVDLSVLSRWTIRPKLMSVEGVANVSVWGMRDRQLQVQADPVRMQQHGVSLDELVASTGNALWVSPLSFLEASTPGRGGFLDLPQQRVNVQHVSPITDSAALGRVAVQGATRPGVSLADVAQIVEAPPTIIGDGIVDDASGLVLVVEKQPGVGTAAVSAGIEEALASLSVGLPGVTMDSSLYRPADYVRAAGRNLAVAGLLALVLVAVGSILLYRAWRPVVTLGTTVGLALVAGWLVLWVREAPVNLVALTGLAAGTLLAVAQGVAAVDAVGRSPRELSTARRIGTAYTGHGTNAVYTGLAAVLVVAPVYLLEGRAGAFLPEAATGFLLATAGCVLVALVVAPALAALLGGGQAPHKTPVPARLSTRATGVATRLAGSAVAVVAILAVGVGAGGALLLGLEVQTRPTFQEPTLLLSATAPEGTSPQALTSRLGSVAKTLREIDGVAGVGGHVGRAVNGDRVVGPNSGELWITLEGDADRDEVASAATVAARSAGDLDATVGAFLDSRVDTVLPDADAPLVVSVYGPDPEVLRTSAQRVLEVVADSEGVGGARLVEPPTEETMQITVDLAKAEALGMTPGDVRRQAATLVGGLEVGAIFEQQKVFDVQVWSGPGLRDSPDKVGALPITTPGGRQVTLADVATVEMAQQPTVIHRESVQRRLDVVADVGDGDTRDAVAAALSRMSLPSEYHAEVRPESASLDANHRDVLLYAGAALLGVLLLLQAATRNWWTAVTATASIPLGMVGAFVAALVVGDLTIGALAGLAAVAVLGVHNALTVVRVTRARADDPSDTARGAAGEAVLPASVLTLLVGLGVVLLGARAGLEALSGLAVVVVGGAMTTGLVALVVLPAVAARYSGREEAVEDFSFDEEALYGHVGVGSRA